MWQVCQLVKLVNMHIQSRYANTYSTVNSVASSVWPEALYTDARTTADNNNYDADDESDNTALLHKLSWPLGQISQN